MAIYEDLRRLTEELQKLVEEERRKGLSLEVRLPIILLADDFKFSPEIQAFIDKNELYRRRTTNISVGQY